MIPAADQWVLHTKAEPVAFAVVSDSYLTSGRHLRYAGDDARVATQIAARRGWPNIFAYQRDASGEWRVVS